MRALSSLLGPYTSAFSPLPTLNAGSHMRIGLLTETGVRGVGLKDQSANLAQDSLRLFIRRLSSDGQKEEEKADKAEKARRTIWTLKTTGFSAEWSVYRDCSNSLSLSAETPSTYLELLAKFYSPKSERPADFPQGYPLKTIEINFAQKTKERTVGTLRQTVSFSTNGAGRCVSGVQRVLTIPPCAATEALMVGAQNLYGGSPHFTLHTTNRPSGPATVGSRLDVSSEGIHYLFSGPETPKLFQMLWRSIEKEDERRMQTTVRMLRNCVL